jgi:Zn-dependent peptidase ImmA (M78 family)
MRWRRRIEQIVRSLRAKHGINEPPVPVEQLARKLGLIVQVQPFKGELSGILVREGGNVIVGVNALHHPNRRRFTIAHEIGHFLLHEGDRVFVDRGYKINLRNPTSSHGTDLEEIEANTFASLLLIPEEFLFRDLAEEGVDIEDTDAVSRVVSRLAQKYRVSQQAMSLRLLNRLPR